MRDRFVAGAVANEVDATIAHQVFDLLGGFAAYGFCKSHAAAFALLTYQSAWLRLYHPTEFYTALLNNQPMGFYSPEVVVNEAQRRGVPVLPVDVEPEPRALHGGGRLSPAPLSPQRGREGAGGAGDDGAKKRQSHSGKSGC